MKKGEVLVIDDENEILELVGDILQFGGYGVQKSPNGTDGIEMAKTNLPDVIVCDLMMSGLDGFEVLRSLRKDPRTAIIPFIFLSAKGNREYVRGGMSFGADDYIVKPFAKSELLASVSARIERKKNIAKSLDTVKCSLRLAAPHEFRTCLNGVLGFAEIIKSSAKAGQILSNEELVFYSERILESGERLYKLVERQNYFMEISSILSDKSSLSDFTKGCCNNLIVKSDGVLQPIASKAERNDDLQVKIEEATLTISPEDWEKLLYELADNAFKFSKFRIYKYCPMMFSDDTLRN